jgi:hypothetical protein
VIRFAGSDGFDVCSSIRTCLVSSFRWFPFTVTHRKQKPAFDLKLSRTSQTLTPLSGL